MKIYSIGDVHGRLDLLKFALEHINSIRDDDSKIVLLGDYVDRGPESAQVVDYLMETQMADNSVICLMGNHERMMLDALQNTNEYGYMSSWLMNGGIETLESYGERAGADYSAYALDYAKHVPKSHIDWLKRLPLKYETENYFFVHAGVNPDREFDDQKEKDLLWIRDYFLKTDRGSTTRKHIVHGHTPHEYDSTRSKFSHRRTNLDSGAIWTNILTVGVFDEDTHTPRGYILVEGSHDDITVKEVDNDQTV